MSVKDQPLASILLLTYNQEGFASVAVRSALTQDYGRVEVVICDDGSTDGTVSAIERELEEFDSTVEVKTYFSKENAGLISNFNRAISMCEGAYIVAMAGDDISLPTRVSTCIEAFKQDPDCMLVLASWEYLSEHGQRFDGRVLEDRCYSYRSSGMNLSVYAGAPVCGAAAAYRRELFDCFGLIREGRRGGEDNYYWFRALLLGHIRTLSEPLVLWRRHAGCLSNAKLPDEVKVSGDEAYKINAVKKHHRFLRNHEKMYLQWWIDLEAASRERFVSGKLNKRLKRLCYLYCELSRFKRYSLSQVPFSLWSKSFVRLLPYCTSFWVLRRVFIRHFRLRFSGGKRSAYFEKRVY